MSAPSELTRAGSECVMHESSLNERGAAEAAFDGTPAWHGLGTVVPARLGAWAALEQAGLVRADQGSSQVAGPRKAHRLATSVIGVTEMLEAERLLQVRGARR